jgi:hypothetical protein
LSGLGQSPAEFTAAKNEYANLVVPPPGQLTPWAKYFQKIILARDYDTLFRILPLEVWGSRWKLGKYSFRDVDKKVYQISQRFLPGGGTPTITTVREYVPFGENSIKRFAMSPYFKVSPAYADGICPPERLERYISRAWAATKAAAEGNRVTDRAHIRDIWPGRVQCAPPQASLWVRIRSKVYIAVAVVAAIYLGPIVMEKVGALIPGGTPGAATGEIVGAGAKAGAVTTKAGAAATKASFFSKVKSVADTALTWYNRVEQVKAIANGELPPPPIGIPGATFREVAFNIVKKEITEAAKAKAAELGVAYIEKKMTEREERKIKAEIADLQRQLDAITPAATPMQPAPELSPVIQKVMVQEKVKSAETNNFLSIAVPLGIGAMLLAG